MTAECLMASEKTSAVVPSLKWLAAIVLKVVLQVLKVVSNFNRDHQKPGNLEGSAVNFLET